ncbi:DUF1573 domain-containing protein [bacterium]|nr:DUF1573 domain-containing protein [bacterium]
MKLRLGFGFGLLVLWLLPCGVCAQKARIFSAHRYYRVLIDSFGEDISFPFYIYNKGNAPLVLYKSRNPKGNCMVSYSHKPIMPGDSQLLVFRHGGSLPYAFKETVTLENNDSAQSNFMLTFVVDSIKNGPILMMPQTLYYFDSVPLHGHIKQDVWFYNIGNEPLLFQSMSGFGGGEFMYFINKPIMPGDSVKTQFVYTTGTPGRWERSIAVRCNDVYSETFYLRFVGVTLPIETSPPVIPK